MNRGEGVKSLSKFLLDNPAFTMLDMSQINTFEQCHRKYSYIYKQNLEDTVGVGALFSSIFLHPLLGHWYETGGASIPESTVTKVYKEFVAAASKRGPELRNAEEYSQMYAKMVLSHYIHFASLDFDLYQTKSSEGIYWMTIDAMPEFVFVSKPDLVLSQISNKQLVAVDFKSSKYDFNRSLIPFDRQFIGQAVTVGAKFMMKNFLHVDLRNGDVRLTREFIPVDSDLMEEWKAELLVTLKEFKLAQDSGIWVKRAPAGCHPYLNTTCDFMNYCTLGSARHKMIDFAEKVNPLSYLGL